MTTTKVKICGLTNADDALAAVEFGADFIGFIQVRESPRYIAPEAVREITRQIPSGVLRVGVFVNATFAEMQTAAAMCELDIIQLHGDEPPESALELGVERVWKAMELNVALDVEGAAAFPAQAVVVDTILPGQRGGTGVVGNWELAAQLACRRRTVLAGGLTPDNVAEAVRRTAPYAVDVSSGIEAVRGRKDHRKMKDFISNAKHAKR